MTYVVAAVRGKIQSVALFLSGGPPGDGLLINGGDFLVDGAGNYLVWS